MNKREKEVQQAYLNNEKAVLKKLEENYKDALAEINSKIEILMARQDADMQHVIYQVEYQKALKTQVQAILETLQANEFETLSDYLTRSYEDGFIGTMYNLQGQGIPLVFPLDQEQIVAAIQHETKLSESLYTALGKDVTDLRKKIAGEISRGIAVGAMYGEIARNIAGWARIPKNNAMRIARTEAHRIQCKASMDACYKAKEKGADVVKQWESSLDGKTRPTHRELDGQIRELDEPFEVAGKSAMFPGDFSDPAEDCNCRCALLQRARWNLGGSYTKWSPDAPVLIDDDGTTQFVTIEEKDYDSFKKQYIRATKGLGANSDNSGIIPKHRKPEVIGNVDFGDKKAVASVLGKFEAEAVNELIETACVITTLGTVYKCFGVEDRVFPDADLGDELIGAIVSHNHPIDYTEYSFSKDDYKLFEEYQLEILRGEDVKYKYEFNRASNEVDEQISIFDFNDTEDAAHAESIERAKKGHVGYRRWKND